MNGENDIDDSRLNKIAPPVWLPNWKEKSEYPDANKTTPQEWAWEFLRRNTEYQKAYTIFCDFIESLSDDEFFEDEGLLKWEQCKRDNDIYPQQPIPFENGITYNFFPFDISNHYHFECYPPRLPDPQNNYSQLMDGIHLLCFKPYGKDTSYSIFSPPQPTGKRASYKGTWLHSTDCARLKKNSVSKLKSDAQKDISKCLIRRKGQTNCYRNLFIRLMHEGIFKLNNKYKKTITTEPRKLLVEISLEGNIKEQLRDIGIVAEGAQRQLIAWNILEESRKKDGVRYLELLRTWDAVQSKATKTEMSNVLLPKEPFATDRPYCQKIDGWIIAAEKKIMARGYIDVLKNIHIIE